MSQHIANDSTSFSNNRNSFNVWNSYTVADDRPKLLTWLSPLDPGLRHWDIQERRVNNVGEWLMQTEEFRRWYSFGEEGGGDKAVLFCYGDPGVGKTFISSLVVDRLCDRARGKNTAVSCFYFDFAARKEQSATSMLGSLVKQMISGMERIPEEISRAFQEQKKTIGGRKPQLVDLVKMLQAIATSQPTFMCIDGLDECAGVQRFRLLGSLKEIVEKSPSTRIFVTGRPHIRAEIESQLARRVASVFVSSARGDIITYLRARLGRDETPSAMDERLETDILEKISETMSEMFLLVSLNIEAVLQESTIYRRRERLKITTHGLGLGDAYSATIERIKQQGGDKSRLGMEALMWISHAERPLTADELCHALAVELGAMCFSADNAPSMSTLVGCCQGLIAVDKEASTVRLIHFTLQEYLSAHHDIFSRPHSAMAEICLTYLNSEQVRALSIHPTSDTRHTPFLGYCSMYWGVHAKRDLSDYARSLSLELLRGYDGHISQKFLAEESFALDLDLENFDTSSSFTGLHCASFFGIVEIVAALLEMECYDINGRGFWGFTPLAWAARNGHKEAVKILLEMEKVNPDNPDDLGRTPLLIAARNGHEEVVKILLEREDVNPDKPDDLSQTPLSFAARSGNEEVVKILLEHEKVNPDNPDDAGQTPLSFAARYGHEGVVVILLGHQDVDPGRPDNDGKTPLSHAASNGYEGVLKILLSREEVNPGKPDNDGRTPLLYAASNGHEGVVKILLGRKEVNPDKPNNHGRTPLAHAASNGHEGVVKMLLRREEVNPGKPDNDGRTPLSYAARHGNEAVVKLLLGREEVNPDEPNNYGRTPLLFAAWSGHERIVEALLRCEEVDPDKPDYIGQTPLSFAARCGHEGVVRILLGREEVSPSKPDNDGKTPLSYAARYGNEEVVTILLGYQEVNPDKPDSDGKTPLSYAASNGHEGVVNILLGCGEVNPDTPDSDGRTPLSYAASNGHEKTVKILLGREEVNPNKPDNHGRTPLMFAAGKGRRGVVALLQPYENSYPQHYLRSRRHHPMEIAAIPSLLD